MAGFAATPVFGQVLSKTPLWSSAPAMSTVDIAVGDVDNDGDLDLVCANDVQGAILFRSQFGMLEVNPAWVRPQGTRAESVALGDIDGDGRLDVVFSGSNGSSVYLNTGTVFADTEDWLYSQGSFVGSLALGDVDQDGDLDVICGTRPGNFGLILNVDGDLQMTPAWEAGVSANAFVLGDVDDDGDLDLGCSTDDGRVRFYRNTGSSFEVAPFWESDTAANTVSLALGDLNGDGRLDLARANLDHANEVFYNTGGTFPARADWTALTRFQTRSVALADADGDGWLDLAFGVEGSASLVYLGGTTGFPAEPTWQSDLSDETMAVAWADLDGDGDPELVCGNMFQTATAFDNIRPVLDAKAIWRGAGAARDLALGDVDGDGDLDVATGGSDPGSEALYINHNGQLDSLSTWVPNPGGRTISIALGDVDGDGSIDLVCGRPDEPNAMYRNLGGTFETTPSWTAAAIESTTSVALGDVDHDGDLDLACSTRGRSRAYRNAGGSFEAQPFWVSDTLTVGAGVALGDVDGDGDLDVVFGNALYKNTAGVLDSTWTWSAGASEHPKDVALGDMDGDLDLDLVFANDTRPNAMYAGDLTAFTPRTEWFPERADGTQGLALSDIDGDGDLDVIGAGSGPGARSVVYTSDLGRLASTPEWVHTPPPDCAAVAAGDLDRDGDMEVVFAAERDRSFAVRGLRRPPLAFDPARPAHQVTNNAAQARNLRLVPEGTGIRRIEFDAVDVESDSLSIVFEYQRAGARLWIPLQRLGGDPREHIVGPFQTSPGGVPQSVDWNLASLPIGRQQLAIRLRAVSKAHHVGVIQYVAHYYADAGEIEISRPILEVPVENVELPVVSLGDTVGVSFRLGNAGNEDLEITSIDLPFQSEMAIDAATPFTIAPGSGRDIHLTYQPVTRPRDNGPIIVHSNDPAIADAQIGLITRTLALEVRTNALADSEFVALGQALTIQTIPVGEVHIEQATLFYKAPGIGLFTELPMRPVIGDTLGTGPRFGVIPGGDVTELGLEYFVQVENSGIFATDPPGAPVDAVFHQPVASADSIDALPQPNSTSGFLAGRSVTVQVAVPQGSQFVRGALHYRLGGSGPFAVDSLQTGTPLPFGTIPDSMVGARGIEYYVEVRTRTDSISEPRTAPRERPLAIRVRVQNLKEPKTHAGGRYRLLSIPLDFLDFTGGLDALLSDEPDFGPYDPTHWRAFQYESSTGNVELPDAPGRLRPRPGRAVWLISRNEHSIDTAPIEGLSTPTRDFTLSLTPGWNAIGNPFAFPVAWEDVTTRTALEPPVAFDPALGPNGDWAPEPVEVLQPFAGYFVENPTDEVTTIILPAKEAGVAAAATAPSEVVASSWRLLLTARSDDGIDSNNLLGVDPAARDEHDALDGREPPRPPGSNLQLCFANSDWRERPGEYRRDLRHPTTGGHAWDLVVRAGTEKKVVVLEAIATGPLPEDLEIVWLDVEQGTRVAGRSGQGLESYRLLVPGGESPYRLRLLAGTHDWVERESATATVVPARFTVQQNAPNPFNGGTRFRFGLPAEAPVTLEIFDVHGRRIAVLAARQSFPAGWHTMLWDGTASSKPAASGVYFFRLRAGDEMATKRMVLLK